MTLTHILFLSQQSLILEPYRPSVRYTDNVDSDHINEAEYFYIQYRLNLLQSYVHKVE